MDILSHTLTGIAIGTIAAAVSNGSWKQKITIILIGGLGGSLPDFDAISLWSKFDSTIGTALNLSHSGNQIYFGKFWYSHHAALHSLLALFLFILLSILLSVRLKISKIAALLSKQKHFYFSFSLGFVFHLLEDMPAPASVWGGVNFFFPSNEYIGGFGKIW